MAGAPGLPERHRRDRRVRPSSGLWIIGLLIYTDDPAGAPWEDILHAAYIDPITGDVVAIRETPVQPF
jgi:hypothetical protein